MKIIYYDMGSFLGEEIDLMISIFSDLNIRDFKIYGFEPCKNSFKKLEYKYRNIDNIFITRAAIGEEDNQEIKLYYTPNVDGYSVFKTKINTYANMQSKDGQEETVISITFSGWLEKNKIEFKDSFNILKFNIEGAEWYLLNDMVSNNLIQYFPVMCGDAWDILKVSQLKDYKDEYTRLIKGNNIDIHSFSGQGGVNKKELLWMKEKICNFVEKG